MILLAILSALSQWIGVDAPVPPGADGVADTACFVRTVTNAQDVVRAVWTVSALGVCGARVNGRPAGEDVLEPGFTEPSRRRQAFAHDVTASVEKGRGAVNVLSAMVSTGWWRDGIVRNPYWTLDRPSGFRGEFVLTYADGSSETVPTDTSWRAAHAGPVVHAEIYWGETYDARVPTDWQRTGQADWPAAKILSCFEGEVSDGAPARVWPRRDLTLAPVDAYVWKGATESNETRYGCVNVVRRYKAGEPVVLEPGETLVVDFGQNAAGSPEFVATAECGTTLVGHPAEMLNDRCGEKNRGNDGSGGSAYVANYRAARATLTYVFGGKGEELYRPGFTFFGGRYFSWTATGRVRFEKIVFVPYSSVRAEDETGSLVTGHDGLNRLISNCLWGLRGNYLSIPTDCPQRDERQGWTCDAQVFSGAAVYAADVDSFLGKWLADLRDGQGAGLPSEQPFADAFRNCAPIGTCGVGRHKIGWGDAGIAVPYRLWQQYGDTEVVRTHFAAMGRFLDLVLRTRYATGEREYQYADWLSGEKLEAWRMIEGRNSPGGGSRPSETMEDLRRLWNFHALAQLAEDARMMREMAAAIGETAAAGRFAAAEREVVTEFRAKHLAAEGTLDPLYAGMQTPAAIALVRGLLPSGTAKRKVAADLVANFKANGYRIRTGFLGTPVILDALSEHTEDPETAYSVLLNRRAPGWLMSVDQGATTIWERWDGYTKEKGFGPASMNSFNHYANGAVLGWMYRTMAGIRPDPSAPGFRKFILAPRPDPRVGSVTARYRSRAGVIESAWTYGADGVCRWTFTVPKGTTATVRFPDGTAETVSQGIYERTIR